MLERLNIFFMTFFLLLLAGAGAYVYLDTSRDERLIIAAGARSSEGFQLVEAIAEVVRRHHPKLEIEVIETGGSLDNSRLIDDGLADMATMQADGSSTASGLLIASLYPDAYHLIVRREAEIHDVADLLGKTIALPSRGSAQNTSFWFLASHYGLTESSLTSLPMSNRAAEWALITGAVDAVFRVRAPGDNTVRHLIERADIALVPIEQSPALHLRKPAIRPGMIPKGSYRGNPPLPQQDLETASVQRWLIASKDVPVKVVYQITSVLFERRRELSELNALASLITAPEVGVGTHLPLHEGAAKYYDREKPSVWSEQANFLRTLVSLIAIFGSMIFAFRNWYQSAQKNRGDAYNKELLALYESAKERRHPGEYYQQELGNILTVVIDDLDNDRISRVGFDEFSFTWQAVSRLLNELSNTDEATQPKREGETP
jgi:TRAP transporter TAXI family solute receptor